MRSTVRGNATLSTITSCGKQNEDQSLTVLEQYFCGYRQLEHPSWAWSPGGSCTDLPLATHLTSCFQGLKVYTTAAYLPQPSSYQGPQNLLLTGLLKALL